MRRTFGVFLAFWTVACATPLARLADRAEGMPVYRWGYQPPTTAELTAVQERLKRAAFTLGIRIEAGVPDNQAYGTFSAAERLIVVRADLPLDAQVQVVAHELGHALTPYGLIDEIEREIFADAVSYLVIRPDRDDLNIYAQYLGRYRTRIKATLKAYANEIRWAVAVLRQEG